MLRLLLPLCITLVVIGFASSFAVYAGAPATEKSDDAAPQPGNLKLEIRVLQLKLPVVCRYSLVYQKVQSSTGSTVMAL